MIGLLAWWIVVLAAPVILVRRWRRRRRAADATASAGRATGGGTAGRPAGPGAVRSGHIGDEGLARVTPLGPASFLASARAAVPVRRFPTPARARGVGAQGQALAVARGSVADRALPAHRRAAQHVCDPRGDGHIRHQRHLRTRALGRRDRSQQARRQDPAPAARLHGAGPARRFATRSRRRSPGSGIGPTNTATGSAPGWSGATPWSGGSSTSAPQHGLNAADLARFDELAKSNWLKGAIPTPPSWPQIHEAPSADSHE